MNLFPYFISYGLIKQSFQFFLGNLVVKLMISPGHFLLTDLLLDIMKKTAQESNREGRIVNISSISHWWPYGEGIRFDKINDHCSG